MEHVIISAKINRELHQKLKKYKIPVSKIVRKALEEEVKKAEEEEIKTALEKIGKTLENIPSEEITNLIRESREER